jgi:hypothetical protein
MATAKKAAARKRPTKSASDATRATAKKSETAPVVRSLAELGQLVEGSPAPACQHGSHPGIPRQWGG